MEMRKASTGKNLGSICLQKGNHFVRFTQTPFNRTLEDFVNHGLTVTENKGAIFNSIEEGNQVYVAFVNTGYKRIAESYYEAVLYGDYR